MPTLVADVKAPRGLVEPSMFWQLDAPALDTRLQEYIDEAELNAAPISDVALNDEATRAYVYYRAFTSVYITLSALPASVSMSDQGSTQYLVTQMANFKGLADEYKARFDALLHDATVEEEVIIVPPRIVGSKSLSINPRW